MDYIEKAYEWYENHKEHVEKIIEEGDNSIKPSKEDIEHPELWKGIHWSWFFDNYNMK